MPRATQSVEAMTPRAHHPAWRGIFRRVRIPRGMMYSIRNRVGRGGEDLFARQALLILRSFLIRMVFANVQRVWAPGILLLNWCVQENCGTSERELVNTETLTCNSCGAPLEVPGTANVVTCNHCSCQLAIRRLGSATLKRRWPVLSRDFQRR